MSFKRQVRALHATYALFCKNQCTSKTQKSMCTGHRSHHLTDRKAFWNHWSYTDKLLWGVNRVQLTLKTQSNGNLNKHVTPNTESYWVFYLFHAIDKTWSSAQLPCSNFHLKTITEISLATLKLKYKQCFMKHHLLPMLQKPHMGGLCTSEWMWWSCHNVQSQSERFCTLCETVHKSQPSQMSTQPVFTVSPFAKEYGPFHTDGLIR